MMGLDRSKIVTIEFYNRTNTLTELWIEPSCISVQLDSKTEYRVEIDDNEYRIEIDEQTIILYLQFRFGPKVYKREFVNDHKNEKEWILAEDYSDLNNFK